MNNDSIIVQSDLDTKQERYYFSCGMALNALYTGDEVRLLKMLEASFDVKLTCRENQLTITGSASSIKKATRFFDALSHLGKLRNEPAEKRDIELLLKTFTLPDGPQLDELWKGRIKLGNGKKDILPRSRSQLTYLNLMRNKDVVFGVGPAGTGKTYLAMAMAVSNFLSGNVSKIVLTRPSRESGERIGYLPGSMEDKVSPYLRPLYDALYEMIPAKDAQDLIQRGMIEIAPLGFMRGRTLNNAFIILDEAQNTTVDQMLMFLTRMGFGSRCLITGDPSQSDLQRNEPSGLLHAVNHLQKLPEIGFSFFTTKDVVRNSLLEKIILAYTEKDNSPKENIASPQEK